MSKQQSLVGPHSPDWGTKASSRLSQTNRHGESEALNGRIYHIDRSEFRDSQPELVPLATQGQTIREECAYKVTQDGMHLPISEESGVHDAEEIRAKPTYQVVDEFHDWMNGYENGHIEFENENGEIGRTSLENSHMESYENRYYARLKDLERGVNRNLDGVTTVMLTLTASTTTDSGFPRPPADHMMEIREGWRIARKHLYKALRGRNWEYGKVWEPHQSGYGHMHVALFIEDVNDSIRSEDFTKFLGSYIDNVESAGSKAHSLDNAVSVNGSVDELACYISEYIGMFQDEKVTERSLNERIFRATCWATGTRRIEFSNGAQKYIKIEEVRRETGLLPQDRGSDESADDFLEAYRAESNAESNTEEWEPRRIEYVRGPTRRERADPTCGGVGMVRIDRRG